MAKNAVKDIVKKHTQTFIRLGRMGSSLAFCQWMMPVEYEAKTTGN